MAAADGEAALLTGQDIDYHAAAGAVLRWCFEFGDLGALRLGVSGRYELGLGLTLLDRLVGRAVELPPLAHDILRGLAREPVNAAVRPTNLSRHGRRLLRDLFERGFISVGGFDPLGRPPAHLSDWQGHALGDLSAHGAGDSQLAALVDALARVRTTRLLPLPVRHASTARSRRIGDRPRAPPAGPQLLCLRQLTRRGPVLNRGWTARDTHS
jgi:hypothetical protein